ncbi:MAG: hypothetical protein JXB48_25015 [Candidatus Latescibacteria bacterium]|nr:hypothetical protein [Candidatus Latescibacterota bacterium]
MNNSDSARRTFWQQIMDEGFEFMESVKLYPIEESCEDFTFLPGAVDEAHVEVEFSDSHIVPGIDRQFYLRSGLIHQFVAAAQELNDNGFILKVEDVYRTRTMQKELAVKQSIFDKVVERVQWELSGGIPPVQTLIRRLAVLVAQCPKTGTHMSGSAIDISVLHRDSGKEVNRGAPYLEMSELTPMNTPFIDQECKRNRDSINALMHKHNFIAYPYEFWHYSSGDVLAELIENTGKPVRYGAVDRNPETNEVSAIENPLILLNSVHEITRRIEQALSRLR